jgi:hypothetical protein
MREKLNEPGSCVEVTSVDGLVNALKTHFNSKGVLEPTAPYIHIKGRLDPEYVLLSVLS